MSKLFGWFKKNKQPKQEEHTTESHGSEEVSQSPLVPDAQSEDVLQADAVDEADSDAFDSQSENTPSTTSPSQQDGPHPSIEDAVVVSEATPKDEKTTDISDTAETLRVEPEPEP
ncbi:hypothetical protein, partial [Aestuariibacter sp. A3R04]|uniref:hypothetical protein n=1 Tax=Aestuariibacter sp. A3R04 TaxID=2841571 RepID=UPI0020916BE2